MLSKLFEHLDAIDAGVDNALGSQELTMMQHGKNGQWQVYDDSGLIKEYPLDILGKRLAGNSVAFILLAERYGYNARANVNTIPRLGWEELDDLLESGQAKAIAEELFSVWERRTGLRR